MTEELNIRQEIPVIDVYIEQPDKSLKVASEDLAGTVREDLQRTSDRIVDQFGQALPPLTDEHLSTISKFFTVNNRALPRSVVIDPEKDALTLRQIFSEQTFPDPSDQEFFTGLNDAHISPGGAGSQDVVIFHDWAERYRQEISDTVEAWNYKIDGESLELAVGRSVVDFVTHELSHLAGHYAVSAVVLVPVNGGYQLTDRSSLGMITVEFDEGLPQIEDDSDYYCGPAIDEGWAAYCSSQVVLELQGHADRQSIPLERRFYVSAEIKKGMRGKPWVGAVKGLHSTTPGMIVEKLDETYPGLIAAMNAVADGRTKASDALDVLREKIPTDLYALLFKPTARAWKSLKQKLEIS